MKQIFLGDHQIKNLKIFLEKVPMVGTTEAIAMVELVQSINNAQEIKLPVKEKEDKK